MSLAGRVQTLAQPASVDYTIRIAPMALELAPGQVIQTYGYNNVVPGPVLRLQESRQVSINIVNDTDINDIIHWHGLFVPSEVNGAMEEGSRMVPARGGSKVYTFTPKPIGTRWYHSHDVAGKRPDTQHVWRSLLVPYCRTRERPGALRQGGAARRAPLGGPLGQYAGPSEGTAPR
jgi:FtsP/CotA-like multicopper oxidase with cupredoxin domain